MVRQTAQIALVSSHQEETDTVVVPAQVIAQMDIIVISMRNAQASTARAMCVNQHLEQTRNKMAQRQVQTVVEVRPSPAPMDKAVRATPTVVAQ